MSVEVALRMTETFHPDHLSHHHHLSNHPSMEQHNALREPLSSSDFTKSRTQRPHGSLSFLPSTTHAPESVQEQAQPPPRFQEKPPIYISPFRSVRKMREPFQLMLPSSPSLENRPSASKDSRALQSPIPLRPLRSCRSEQNLVADAFESFGLLPSPSLSESRLPHRRDSFPPKCLNPKAEAEPPSQRCSCAPPTTRCELCVVSSYEGDISVLTNSKISSERSSTPSLESRAVDETSTVSSKTFSSKTESLLNEMQDIEAAQRRLENVLGTPIIPSEVPKLSSAKTSTSRGTDLTGTPSQESEWALNNLSYCESWLQNVPAGTHDQTDDRSSDSSRRKCQMIEPTRKAVNLRIDTEAANKSMLFAVAPKSKPKLVDISRPSSPATAFSVQIQPPPSWRRPSTPERSYEISAFSPDTPMDPPDSGYGTQPCSGGRFYDSMTDDESALCGHGNLPNANYVAYRAVFKDKPKSARAYVNSTSSTESRPHQKVASPSVPLRQRDETLQKWWEYEWCLCQLESSVKDFPKTMLRLTSPVIILLRQNHERTLIQPFKKIFPNAAESLLDYLCAALIGRNYLVNMAATHHRSGTWNQVNNLSRLDSVPEKARATLGIYLPTASKSDIPSQLMGSKSVQLRKGLDRIIDKLISTLCGRSDEALKASLTVLIETLESH